MTIAGEEWSFRDISSIRVDCGRPWPVVVSGSAPTIIMPCRIPPDLKITVTCASRSVIEEADERPLVIDRLGSVASWGLA